MRKILYSPGYGAGWTSWEYDQELAKFMIDYPAIVEYVENGGEFEDKYLHIWESGGEINQEKVRKLPECLQKFINECQEKFNKVPYLSGLRDIEVKTVYGPVRITDYDGSESVEEGGGEWL
jgi:hypothetical protein